MNPNYKHTITIYNRIKAEDIGEKHDVWHKKVVHDCSFINQKGKTIASVSANSTSQYIVRISRLSDYLQYREYITSPEGHFTLSMGDVVILGNCTEPYSRSLVHSENAFEIKSISDNRAYAGSHIKVTS